MIGLAWVESVESNPPTCFNCPKEPYWCAKIVDEPCQHPCFTYDYPCQITPRAPCYISIGESCGCECDTEADKCTRYYRSTWKLDVSQLEWPEGEEKSCWWYETLLCTSFWNCSELEPPTDPCAKNPPPYGPNCYISGVEWPTYTPQLFTDWLPCDCPHQ